jgi:hypothetical protein
LARKKVSLNFNRFYAKEEGIARSKKRSDFKFSKASILKRS